MTVAVFSDIHGSVSATRRILDIVSMLKPDRTVICGDIYGWGADNNATVGELLSEIDSLAVVMGNNDSVAYQQWSTFTYRDMVLLSIGGRTVLFTHGHRYNIGNIPPLLGSGDILVHGHTHIGRITKYHDIVIANVGSVSLPRSGEACYMVVTDTSINLYSMSSILLTSHRLS